MELAIIGRARLVSGIRLGICRLGHSPVPRSLACIAVMQSAVFAGGGKGDARKLHPQSLASVSADVTPPTSTFDVRQGGVSVSGGTVSGTISLVSTASDGSGSGVQRVTFYIDGKWYAAVTSVPYTTTVDTTKLTNGVHKFLAYAMDNAGNWAFSTPETITVSTNNADTIPPTGTASISGTSGTLNLTATASDQSGIQRVTFYIDRAFYKSVYSAPYTATLNSLTLTNGTHTFLAYAMDKAGNLGYLNHGSAFTVSNGPLFNLVYNYNTYAFTIGVAIPTDTPSNGGSVPVSYSVSPALPAGISLNPTTGVITGTPSAITVPNAYVVTAKNGAGSTDAYLFFRVIPLGPTISIQPANASVRAGQTAVFGVVASGTGSLAYQWQLNGNNIPGATSASYTVPPTTAKDSGEHYQVIVTDPYGSSATSQIATLTVADATTRFSETGYLITPRQQQTATLLANGKVLISGGEGIGSAVTACELYDPTTGAFNPTGSLGEARVYHTATLLPNGKVLITGGDANGFPTADCELYDPTTGAWSPTGMMSVGRALHTATLLPNGMVLIAGGIGSSGDLTSAELFDPSTGQFTPTGSLHSAAEFFTACPIPGGKVLLLETSSGGGNATAELYDPTTGVFTLTGTPNVTRAFFSMTLLPTGKVLITGGQSGGLANACEIYDPSTGLFSVAGSLKDNHGSGTVTLLADGNVLIAGGNNADGTYARSELYDPATGMSAYTASLNNGRELDTATLLGNGKVLITGGFGGTEYVAPAELYDPQGPTP